jgi:hypothetical protein
MASLKKEEIDCILRKISKPFPEVYYQVFYAPSPFIKEWTEEEGL